MGRYRKIKEDKGRYRKVQEDKGNYREWRTEGLDLAAFALIEQLTINRGFVKE